MRSASVHWVVDTDATLPFDHMQMVMEGKCRLETYNENNTNSILHGNWTQEVSTSTTGTSVIGSKIMWNGTFWTFRASYQKITELYNTRAQWQNTDCSLPPPWGALIIMLVAIRTSTRHCDLNTTVAIQPHATARREHEAMSGEGSPTLFWFPAAERREKKLQMLVL